MDLSPDLIVAGAYRLESLLGSGSSGTVWRAVDLNLGRPVALKVLRADLLRDEVVAERFRREARLLASLTHPALVTIYSLISVEDAQGRVAPAIVMPLVEGRLLSEVLRLDGPMELTRAATLLRELVDALGAAHALGIVHRDLKPQNLMLESREANSGASSPGLERLRVLDFGVARSTAQPVTASSVVAQQVGALIGTPGYISPEQITDPARVDGRADLWAAGVCLYEMLTGALPFTGSSAPELIGNVLVGAWRSPRELRPELPPAVDEFFGAVFRREISKRPADAAAMMRALDALLAARALGPAGSPARAASATPVASAPVSLSKSTQISGSMRAVEPEARPSSMPAPAPGATPSVRIPIQKMIVRVSGEMQAVRPAATPAPAPAAASSTAPSTAPSAPAPEPASPEKPRAKSSTATLVSHSMPRLELPSEAEIAAAERAREASAAAERERERPAPIEPAGENPTAPERPARLGAETVVARPKAVPRPAEPEAPRPVGGETVVARPRPAAKGVPAETIEAPPDAPPISMIVPKASPARNLAETMDAPPELPALVAATTGDRAAASGVDSSTALVPPRTPAKAPSSSPIKIVLLAFVIAVVLLSIALGAYLLALR